MREPGAGQILDVHTTPVALHQQVLIGCERLVALGEALVLVAAW
jgi:hypothetical protein